MTSRASSSPGPRAAHHLAAGQPVPHRAAGQSDALIPRPRLEVAPGAVHLPDWLDLDEQRHLVLACRDWATPRASGEPAMRAPRLPSGAVMSVRSVCLGWHWRPYRYSRTVDDGDGGPVLPFPTWLADLGRRAVADAYRDPAAGAAYGPDIALVNYYDEQAKMGLHQDRDERSRDPVVSLSLGDTCVFRFGNTENRNRPWTDLELCSGDLFVFGGPSRLAYHGVPRTMADTGDPATGLAGGRLNITLRVSGLDA
jgi:alkylated DNA repair protein (DNA oxidative demethylase)